MRKSEYLSSIIALRGLAALGVCMFHFTKGFSSENGYIREFFQHGWMGVEVFFVISGFVIPYSLISSGYKITDFLTFLYKRIIRIEPTYIASILLILTLNYLSSLVPQFMGQQFFLDGINVLLHLGYLVRLFGETWLNPVYWTLEIEFHYYILIGLLIPLVILKNNAIRVIIMLVLLILPLYFNTVLPLFKYLDIFLLGILIAMFKSSLLSTKPIILLLTFSSGFVWINHGITISILTLITALIIAFFGNKGNNTILMFLGNISYSLYLLHVPIGGRIINILKRLDLTEFEKFGGIFCALLVSISAAWVFYKLVEFPSHKLSKKIIYFEVRTSKSRQE